MGNILTSISEVAASKANVIEAGLEVCNKIFELVGARGSLSKWGLDRFWRNMRGAFNRFVKHCSVERFLLTVLTKMI